MGGDTFGFDGDFDGDGSGAFWPGGSEMEFATVRVSGPEERVFRSCGWSSGVIEKLVAGVREANGSCDLWAIFFGGGCLRRGIEGRGSAAPVSALASQADQGDQCGAESTAMRSISSGGKPFMGCEVKSGTRTEDLGF